MANYERNRFILAPKGQAAQILMREGYISNDNMGSDSLQKAAARLNTKTGEKFCYGIGTVVPDTITVGGKEVKPLLYLNEQAYGIPSDSLEQIPELAIFDDTAITRWIMETVPNVELLAADIENLWVFPGGGGNYMRGLLALKGLSPLNQLSCPAKRLLDEKGKAICCNIDLPSMLSSVQAARRLILVDDNVSTGITIEAVIQSLKTSYNWTPEEITVITQTMGIPRSKESLFPLLNLSWSIYTGLLYGGQNQRPRLLTTGSIIRGSDEPERFSAKGYPPEIVEKVRRATRYVLW